MRWEYYGYYWVLAQDLWHLSLANKVVSSISKVNTCVLDISKTDGEGMVLKYRVLWRYQTPKRKYVAICEHKCLGIWLPNVSLWFALQVIMFDSLFSLAICMCGLSMYLGGLVLVG